MGQNYSLAISTHLSLKKMVLIAKQPNAGVIFQYLLSELTFGNITWLAPVDIQRLTNIEISNTRKAIKWLIKNGFIQSVIKQKEKRVSGYKINPFLYAKPGKGQTVTSLQEIWLTNIGEE